MRHRAVPFALLLSTACVASPDDNAGGGWRAALADQLDFIAPVPVPKATGSPLRPGVSLPDFDDDDADLVPLPLMTVAAHRELRGLDKGIASTYRKLRAQRWSLIEGGPIVDRDIGPFRFTVRSGPEAPLLISLGW